MPNSIKDDFETFEKNYSRWNSNPAFKPKALFALDVVRGQLSTTHATAAEYENFIDSTHEFLNDNDVIEMFKNKKFSEEKYAQLYTAVRAYFPKIVTGTSHNSTEMFQTADGLRKSFRGQRISARISSTTYPAFPVPVPQQIIDFYDACANIAYWLVCMNPPR